MSNNGVVPKDKLSVTPTETKGTTTLSVAAKNPSKTSPQWVGVVLSSGNVKSVTIVAFTKAGAPVGTTKVLNVDKPTENIDAMLDTPVTADHIVLVLTPISPLTPTHVDVLSAVACMYDEGNFLSYFSASDTSNHSVMQTTCTYI
jgi:hypothetical protein